MAFRDDMAKRRALADAKGLPAGESSDQRDVVLIHERTGKPAVSDRGTTAFNVKVAIQRLSVDATPRNA